MAIGGIGSYGNYSNYQQSVSQIRLQQALSKNTKYQQSSGAADKASYDSGFKSNSMDFLKSYSSTMSDVMDSANALRDVNSSNVTKQMEVSSSDTVVASVSVRYPSRKEQDFALEVSQVAAGQQNVSAGVKSAESAAANMDFTLNGVAGSVDVNVSAQKDDGTARTNKEMLGEAVKQINAGKTGVTASITNKNGVSTLTLKSDKTGTSSAFTVTGDMGAAAGADKVEAEAQNAQYSVTTNKVTKEYTSQSNDITLDTGKIAATLKGTGESTISINPSNEKIVSAVEDLIDSYNGAKKFLNANTDHGIGVENQSSKFERSLLDAKSMEKLGISKNKDGSLSLDKNVLTKSLKEDPKITKQLISGSNGLAQATFQKATSAMSTNSASLVSRDLQEIDQAAADASSYQFMNMYSRNGAYNMSNYSALGMMMNYLV